MQRYTIYKYRYLWHVTDILRNRLFCNTNVTTCNISAKNAKILPVFFPFSSFFITFATSKTSVYKSQHHIHKQDLINIMEYQMSTAINYISRIVCLLIANFLAIQGFAQSGKFFNASNNLSSSFTTQVFEDHNGFIWIASRNGLNVYDGYTFTVFNKDIKDNRGFCNNYINCLNEDKNGNIIIGTNNGVMIYNGKKFVNLPMMKNGKKVKSYINDILCRKNGETWVSTSGYGMMRIRKDYSLCEDNTGKALASYLYLYKATEDRKGRVWVITADDYKLVRLEANGKLTRQIAGAEGLKAKTVVEDKQGNIILATENQGVYEMKNGTNRFDRIPDINIRNIDIAYVGKNNQLYIGSNGGGLCIYNLQTHKLIEHPFFSSGINLTKAKINSVIEDRQGNIWMSMLQKGVFMQPNDKTDFEYMGNRLGARNLIGDNCVTSIILDKKGKIWIGTDKDGLYSLTRSLPMIPQRYNNEPSTILALCEDAYGNIWLGSYREGVGYIDGAGQYHPVDLLHDSTLSVFDIKTDPSGNLWFATMGHGLVCLRPDGSIRNYKAGDENDNNPKANYLPNNYLAKLSFSKDYSKLYVASSIGLSCLDIHKDSWVSTFAGKNCLNKGSFSHCVLGDSKGYVWYGTEEGLFCYNLKDIAHPTHYSMDNGLSSNCIASIAEDTNGNIWVGTVHGLNMINPQTHSVRAFYAENGLQSNEFSDGAIFAANIENLILLGGTDGINWFNPKNIKQSKWKAKLIISNFIVGNTNIYADMESGSYTITHDPIYDSQRFDLSHNDNTFSLQLSTLTYNNVEQISYAYSINGDEWHTLQQGQNEISFSHLAPGTYKFTIRAINNGEVGATKNFTIVIHPAWYASIWARIVYLLIFAALVYFYIKYRKKKEEDKLQLQEHIHAEELGEAKLKFFMNISHEIRTPLTLIVTPLLSLIQEDKDPHRQGIYDIIRKNSERILHLINQMMDLRKIDKGQMVMRMSETDMVTFLQDEYDLFKQQAIAKNIKFIFTHDAEKQPLWIDHNNFDKVLMNLLSNAFKFTPAGGKIQMSLTHTQKHAYISIKDNGVGIPDGQQETIFQRFYQSPTNAHERNLGTGIGLDLTRSLVELHYGSIVARNNKSDSDPDFKQGSEFVIRLPLGSQHLKPEEFAIEVKEENLIQTIEEENTPETIDENVSAAEVSEPPTGGKAHIAVVEDDEAILEYLQAQLSSTFTVSIYHNGKEALPEIIKQQPELVISDIMMPEMNGNVLCTKLKSNVLTNHIPVILLTAMSREEDQLAGLQTGADAYIVKPFNMEILRRTILNLLSVRRTLQNKFTGNESQEDKVDDVQIDSPDKLLLDRVMEVINENMMNEDLSVEMIAKEVGISRVHLHRKMKELTNQTPHSFIRNIRLKRAAKLLKESRQNVTEVMYVCGFTNPASFSTMFKNMYGCSPRDYMNNQRTEAK